MNKKFYEKGKVMCVCMDYLNPYPDEVFKKVDNNAISNIYPYYLISNYGRIYNIYTNSYVVAHIGTDGYYYFTFSTYDGLKRRAVHRVEMLTFFPIEDKTLQVNHIDGNKTNNYIVNLEWVTRSENIKHAYDIGLQPPPEQRKNTSLNKEKVIAICEMLSRGDMTQNQIAEVVGCSRSAVDAIKRGETWTYISKDYIFPFGGVRAKSNRYKDKN